ncbi:MAG: hypothetical protein NT033_02555, partial [Candidatus Omnitrophica bacterium]|nr:hypothetical protein [Candidatus Omnitrophota bacterium]
ELSSRQVQDLYASGAPNYAIYRSTTTGGTYSLVAGGDLLRNGDAETGDTSNWSGFGGATNTDFHQGNNSFYVEGSATTSSSDFIPIDLSKPYYLEGWFKSYGAGASNLYFGFVPYDANKVQIGASEIMTIDGTETTLYAACSAGDKIVKVTNGANWQVSVNGNMAFNVDDSGNYNDLPNRNRSNSNIVRVQNMGSWWEIEFNTTVGLAYAAGIKVREHSAGGSYMYTAAGAAAVPTTWTKYSSTTQGESTHGWTSAQWWRGTRYFKILMLVNYSQDAT